MIMGKLLLEYIVVFASQAICGDFFMCHASFRGFYNDKTVCLYDVSYL